MFPRLDTSAITIKQGLTAPQFRRWERSVHLSSLVTGQYEHFSRRILGRADATYRGVFVAAVSIIGVLDIAIQQKDVVKFRELLQALGYEEIRLETARPHNFVLGDRNGHEIDAHVIVLDEQGNGIYGPVENGEIYPAAALTGIGKIDGQAVRCISAEWAIRFHSGYELTE